MKILHLSDLHFGKTLHSISLIESGDQPHWVDQTIEDIRRERPDAVVIAGDVYDRGVPSRDAVQLFSRFLTAIAKEMAIPVLLTAGNHDGGERLEFARDILEESNVHIAGTVDRTMARVTLNDEYGPVTFWLMPFIFPAAVRTALALEENEISSYTEAAAKLLEEQPIDYSKRNILIAHQMVIHAGEEPVHSESETAVGGVGGMDDTVFRNFDYTALGHIHGAQKIGGDRIRYSGAPLCYHFSEAGQKKGLLYVTIGRKEEELRFETHEIAPLHRVRPTMTMTLAEVLEYEQNNTARNEFVRVELTDDAVPHDAREKITSLLETHGSRLLDISAVRRSIFNENAAEERTEDYSPEDYFRLFYREQRGTELSEKDSELLKVLSQQVTDRPDRTEEELLNDLVEFALRQEELN